MVKYFLIKGQTLLDSVMKFGTLRLVIVSALLVHASCSLNPSWLLDRPYDWDTKRERFPDTEKNRARHFRTYASHARREAAGVKLNWELVWRGIFTALEESNDRPDLYKDFIISERRKHGLPELSFAR